MVNPAPHTKFLTLPQATRPALAHLVGYHEMSDSFALGGERLP
jgi:hypothetical protein